MYLEKPLLEAFVGCIFHLWRWNDWDISDLCLVHSWWCRMYSNILDFFIVPLNSLLVLSMCLLYKDQLLWQCSSCLLSMLCNLLINKHRYVLLNMLDIIIYHEKLLKKRVAHVKGFLNHLRNFRLQIIHADGNLSIWWPFFVTTADVSWHGLSLRVQSIGYFVC